MYIIHVERSMIYINRPIAMVMDHWCKNIVTVIDFPKIMISPKESL